MKKKILIIFLIVMIIGVIMSSFFIFQENDIVKKEDNSKYITGFYSEFVKVNSKSPIFKKIGDKYEKIGILNEGYELSLNEINITSDTKYFEFEIEDSVYYIEYENVTKIETLSQFEDRYKSYLPFNENINVKDVKLYEENELLVELEININKPIIMKDGNKLYIEFDNRLMYVLSEEVEVVQNTNTSEVYASDVPVVAYHFVYLDGDTTCNQIICHSESQIRSHFSYIKDNNYVTINTTEMGMFIDGKINLPEESILITVDDGWYAEFLYPIVDEYEIDITLFLVTSWYDKEQFYSPYIEFASHGHDLHNVGECPGGQGGAIKCWDYDKLMEDLKLSRDELDNTLAFCYPFYEYNDYSISVLKDAGFEMAFMGGGYNAKIGIDKYKIPRHTILSYTTLEQFKQIIK